MADEPNIEQLQATLAGAQARIKELNEENKGHRLNARNTRRERRRSASIGSSVKRS